MLGGKLAASPASITLAQTAHMLDLANERPRERRDQLWLILQDMCHACMNWMART